MTSPSKPSTRHKVVRVTTVLAAAVFACASVARAQVSFGILHAFGGSPDGASPDAPLIQGADGNFYGTTYEGGGEGCGGRGCGTVFRMTPDGTVMILHAFAGGTDGIYPGAALIQTADGNFYGTTAVGGGIGFCGYGGCGTAFQMTTDGIVTILHAFGGGTDGAFPAASALIQATDGNFYGTTYEGGGAGCGSVGCGTAFRMTPDGTVTILHAFAGGIDGATPYAALIQATDGNFYGTTEHGGGVGCEAFGGCGTVFQMTPDGAVTILHAFASGTDGVYPTRPLMQASDGNFYGTTEDGGGVGCEAYGGCGTAFRMTPDGTVTILHAFAGGTDGAYPLGALLEATDGNFYGTTLTGGGAGCGSYGCGTAFQMTPDGTVTVLHAFSFGTDGADPVAGLIQATDGSFYGTTEYGGGAGCGSSGCGTVYQITPGGFVETFAASAISLVRR
jgi:uncharacterized repeat protein (TIGR03803 family)